MDVVKRKLTRLSSSFDIAIWMLKLVNDLMNERVYSWGHVLLESIREFFHLMHKTFYMPHHTIALLLEALGK